MLGLYEVPAGGSACSKREDYSTKDSPSGLEKQEFLGRLYVILNLTLQDLELKSPKGMSIYT